MRPFTLFAAGAALLAVPAFAQTVGVGGQAGVGVDVGAPLSTISDRLAGTVDQVDGTLNRTVDSTNLRVATREQVRAGAEIRDGSGASVGTVQSVEGDVAVVVNGGKLYNIPLSDIYRDTTGKTTVLVTKLSRSSIKARAAAGAEVQNN
jgi:hypothetical protein